MNPAGKAEAVLVPPRPNLGPEPLPRRPSMVAPLLVVLLVAAGVLSLLVRARRRARLRASGLPRAATPAGPFATRRDQMAAWSAAVREALAARFGAHWSAKTTEEIAADATLAEAFGPEPASRLVAFLAEADRSKFDDRDGLQPPLPGDLPDWLVEFVTPGFPVAGARSRISGK